ncbi:Flagellar basal-body rod protein FlgG [Campylobacter majalis]|uniref:Flagellar basal-body rod protein FlgG n=1 Tax=Campylobacter majalis TaxID=2790656 RepID=A0ABM8Q9U6_9BACT|nr:flagellar hook-basal body protein [Campylobacter majalis]CAD7289732.1 Flagellar basal-body rod protein FlgG [Campylobacter majalis]
MQNGYYQATGAMITQFNRLNVITNNLANINTIGYKRDDVVIGDFERIFKQTYDELPLKNHTKDAAKYLNRAIDRVPRVVEQYTDFSEGGLKTSSNAFDFVLKQDDLFFLLDTPSGVKLSKNGAFSLDSEGYIVSKEGYRVLPNNYPTQPIAVRGIQIPQGVSLNADKNGNLYTHDINNPEEINEIGRFYIAKPRDVRDLERFGDNLYELKNLDDIQDIAESNVVLQGFVQISNVNTVTEMVGLIQTQRMVEMYQKVMTSHMEELNNDAITKLAATRA